MNKRFSPVSLALVFLLQASFSLTYAQEPYYKGKTIRFLVNFSAGGPTDVFGMLIARYFPKHVAGNPPVVVQNMAGAGGSVSANYLYNVAKPDGLTILAVNRANYLEQMVGRPEVKLDFRKLNWLGSFNRAPMMITCRKDSGFTTIDALRNAKNPARFGEGGTGSISYVFSSLLGEIFDFKVKHVTGYGSAREIDLGIERGEADCRATTDIALVRPPWPTWAQQGFMVFVVQQGPAKSRLLPQTTPTVYELAPPAAKATLSLMDVIVAYTDFDRPFAAPPAIPKDRLQILRDAFEKMLADANFLLEAKKLVDWDGTSYMNGLELQKKIEKTITQPPDVIKRIKDILQESS